MKNIILFLVFSMATQAQVAIGSNEPKATLDLSSLTNGNQIVPDGILIPRISKLDLANKLVGTYTSSDQRSTIVFVNQVQSNIPSNSPSINQVVNISDTGFYYFGVDNVWHKISANINQGQNLYNIYTDDGELSDDRTVHQDGKPIVFRSKQESNNAIFGIGESIESPTFFVKNSTSGDGYGIGINTANPTTQLHVKSNTAPIFKLVDSSENSSSSSNQVLLSNDNGDATWRELSYGTTILGNSITTSVALNPNNTISARLETKKIGANIILDEGYWLIYIGQMIASDQVGSSTSNRWMRITLGNSESSGSTSSSTNLVPNDFCFSLGVVNLIAGSLGPSLIRIPEISDNPQSYNLMTGVIPIYVKRNGVNINTWFREYSYATSNVNQNISAVPSKDNYLFAVPYSGSDSNNICN